VTTTAILLSSLALVLSLASLAWQSWTWLRSGPVLRVELSDFLTDAASGPGEGLHYFLQVTVINRGRAATTIDAWGIEPPHGSTLVAVHSARFSTRLPARVEPHASLAMFMPADTVRSFSEQHGVPYSALRVWVRPAAGKPVYARKGIPLD
jgi:hypothetical protein